MSLFKKQKPVIKVISVKHEIRDVEEMYTTHISSYVNNKENIKTKKVNFTIVLGSKDGELFTKEFNGSWDLRDIKKWEDL